MASAPLSKIRMQLLLSFVNIARARSAVFIDDIAYKSRDLGCQIVSDFWVNFLSVASDNIHKPEKIRHPTANITHGKTGECGAMQIQPNSA